MILYELLEKDFEFNFLEKIKIFVIKSPSRTDRLMADFEEFYISDIPYHLLRKKVFKVYHFENAVEVYE